MRLSILCSAALIVLAPAAAQAQDRYRERPPVVVSPDLAAPWVRQLQQAPERRVLIERPRVSQGYAVRVAPQAAPMRKRVRRQDVDREPMPQPIEAVSVAGAVRVRPDRGLSPEFLPQMVAYDGGQKPGTIVIDTHSKFLYLVEADGQARRYGVGVGKEGFGWTGTETITNKRQWPTWTPPAEMRAREKRKGRILPVTMEGGPANPLGARALYLGSTLYRIHGTNAPWTIGTNVSSGCIRMRNEDVTDLYERVRIGTKVVVI
ncbi:L,D-transpeptidase [Tianweitania sp. BSSL-BM11]|uniref:L,D-transpeptidase n=1 Tax=Tianweitania aestuarii TaxID=2814886 RepID=A0ABS5RR07_9HYPH|nr:L,D-transpeptidase [Tianweitania aestuarii]MBS9719478.1 L,D-transpeptidase [Tianweitania aestuarii]